MHEVHGSLRRYVVPAGTLFVVALCRMPVFAAGAESASAQVGAEMKAIENQLVQAPKVAQSRANPSDWRVLLRGETSAATNQAEKAEEAKPDPKKEVPAPQPAPAAEVKPAQPPPVQPAAAPAPAVKPPQPPPPPQAEVGVERFKIAKLVIEGDADLIDMLGLRMRMEADLTAKPVSMREIGAIALKYQSDCVSRGFYLTSVMPKRGGETDYAKGTVVYVVDKGRVGKMAFYGSREKPDDPKRPFAQRYFSERQLRRQLSSLQEGAVFDYAEFYRGVFGINSQADIKMDTDLKVRRERAEGGDRRYADMDFMVRENLPIHAVIEANNKGTKSTEEWRLSAWLQHLNLTKHGDVLTVNPMCSPDFKTLRSLAGSYYIPYYIGNGGGFTVFGGFSEVQAKELAPDLDLEGSGWFAGAQVSYKLITNRKHLLSVSLGGTYRYLENNLLLSGCLQEQKYPSDATIIPLSLAFSYSTVKPDALDGRNFATSETSFNLGGSSEAELRNSGMRNDAIADYLIERIQIARVQPMFGYTRKGETEKRGQWVLFGKVDGQISNGALIPVEEKAIGGMDTVRGYIERESMGDNGVAGTLELRTPLIPAKYDSLLQFVTFVDAAYVNVNKSIEGDEDSHSLVSAGAGLRLGIGDRAQLRFDWGFPLKATDDSESSGRAHVSCQVQF